MNYESRIFVAGKFSVPYDPRYTEATGKTEYTAAEKFADMRLSRMPFDFKDIFTQPVTWKFYGDNDINYTEDRYGDTCRYTDLQTVIDYLEKSEATEHRRRNAPAIAMLKAYAAEQWDDEMIVIHYGY